MSRAKPKPNTKAESRKQKAEREPGRPAKWRPEYQELTHKLALLGLTDEQMAPILGVSVATFNTWKQSQPGFLETLKDGRAVADAAVTRCLFQRATGYSHEAVKIFNNNGAPLVVPFVEHYAPDTVACIFWLKNRQPKLWRDRAEIEHSGGVDVAGLPHDVLEVMRKLAIEKAKQKPTVKD